MPKRSMTWIPFIFIPLVAWSRDLAVAILVLGAVAVLFWGHLNWREIFITSLRTPWALSASAFIFWSLIAVIWAPHLPFAAWLKVFIAVTAISILTTGLVRLPAVTIRQLSTLAIMSALALFGLLLFERLTDGLLIRIDRSSDTPVQILNTLSGGLVLLSCVCFPMAWLMIRRTGRRIWPIAFIASCFSLSLIYRMDAIPVGLLAGTLSALIVLRWHTRGFLVVVVTAGLLAVSWAPLTMSASALHLDSWLMENIDRNWGYRIIIWHYVGELVREHFIIGYGFDSARVLGAAADLLPDRSGNSTFLHPHNGILQIWLELGVSGVALFVTTAILLARRILNCAPSSGALAAATGTIIFSTTIWLLSYGIWQGWWIAVLGLAASAVILVLRVDAEERHNT